eukprot:Hpha_TRINITY_DN14932_c0_g6::TRINITY_DN14932_c0_g6_i1::g.143041::m.143041
MGDPGFDQLLERSEQQQPPDDRHVAALAAWHSGAYNERVVTREQFGGGCGKGLYLAVIGASLVIGCVAISLRAEAKIEDLLFSRAEFNKIQQTKALATLMESAAAVLQDGEQQRRALQDLAAELNRHYLRGSMEVQLVYKEQDCIQNCDIHLLTQARNEHQCPTPDEVESSAAELWGRLPTVDNTVPAADQALAPQCEMKHVLPVARRVLAGETGSVRALDYARKDVIYAFRPVGGTAVGLILKQDSEEVAGSTDLISKVRWYGGLITYACTAVLLFLLLVMLRQVERGNGFLPMVGLVLVALSGCLAMVWLMTFIDDRAEGHQQQLRETADGAGVLLAGYQSLFASDVGPTGVHTSILRQWIASMNEVLDPNFEATLVQVQFALRQDTVEQARFATVLSATRFPCSTECMRGLAGDVARKALLHPEGDSVPLYHGARGYIAAGRDEAVQRAEDTQLEFGWMVNAEYVDAPYGPVVDDLWDRTTFLCIGYCLVALIASLLACKFVPSDSAGIATSGARPPWQRLSWVMPLCFVLALSTPMLVVATSSTTALSGIGSVKMSYLTRSHADAMIESAKVAQAMIREMEAEYRMALIGKDEHPAGSPPDQRINNLMTGLRTQLSALEHTVRWLEGQGSAPLQSVQSVAPDLQDFFDRIGFPALSTRAGMQLDVNATLVSWKTTPDEAMSQARSYLNQAREEVFNPTSARPLDPRGPFAESFFELESILWDLEILIRQEVVRMEQNFFTSEHLRLLTAFEARVAALRGEQSWLQLADTSITVVNARLADVVAAVQGMSKDFDKFQRVEADRLTSHWSTVIAEGLTNTQPVNLKVLVGDSRIETRTVPASQVFDVVTQQLQRVASAARIHVMRSVYVKGDIEIQRDAVLRAVWCGVGAVVVAWIATTVTYWMYVREAEANVVSGLPGVVNYPSAEIGHFAGTVTILMVVFLLELIVVWRIAGQQLDELHDNVRLIEDSSKVATSVANWRHQISALTSRTAGYALTGERGELLDFQNQYEAVRTLQRVGLHEVETAQPSSLPSGVKEEFTAAFHAAVDLADELRKSAVRRTEYIAAPVTYTYESLRRLISDRIVYGKTLDDRLKRAENPSVKLRDEVVRETCGSKDGESPGVECESLWETKTITASGLATLGGGRQRVDWTPHTIDLKVDTAYKLVFSNNLSVDHGEVSICVGPLTASAAVWKVQTDVSDWDVPYATRLSVSPGSKVAIYLKLVQTGIFIFADDSGGGCNVPDLPAAVTVGVTGTEPQYVVDAGLPQLVQDRLCDERRQPRHPEWLGAMRFDVDLVQTGGMRDANARGTGTKMRMMQMQPYRVGVHGFEPPGCTWTVTHLNTFCQTDLRKDISNDMPLDVCRATAALDPDCSNVIYSNGTACRCVQRGEQCDYLQSMTGMNISRLDCAANQEIQPPARTGVDTRALSGHVLWSAVEDRTARVEIPYVRGIELRGDSRFGARTYVSLIPIDRGLYDLRTLSGPQVMGTQAEVSRGCHTRSTELECSAEDALECLWDGELCSQNNRMVSAMNREVLECTAALSMVELGDTAASAFQQGRLSDNLWYRLNMRRAAQIMHSNHDAYVISSVTTYRSEAESYADYFKGNLSKVADEGAGLLTMFETWKHKLNNEDVARYNLSRTGFIEDVFLNLSRTQSQREAVARSFASVQGSTRQVLLGYLEWSEHNTRFLFWSCAAVCWFFCGVAVFLLHRLEVAVRLSNEYCFRNVPTRIPRVTGNMVVFDEDEDGEEEEFELADVNGVDEEDEEDEESM